MTSHDFDVRSNQTDRMILERLINTPQPRHTTCGENGDSCRCLPGKCKLLDFSRYDVGTVNDLWNVR